MSNCRKSTVSIILFSFQWLCHPLFAQESEAAYPRIHELTGQDYLTQSLRANGIVLFRTRGFCIDSKGNVFILDAGNYRVVVCNADGEFLFIFGRRGQGPGELISANHIFCDNKDRIYISQSNISYISIFNNQGMFIETRPLTAPGVQTIMDFVVTPREFIIANIFDTRMLPGKDGIGQVTHAIRAFFAQSTDTIMLSDIYSHPAQTFGMPFTTIVTSAQGDVYFARFDETEYAVQHYNAALIEKTQIRKDYDPVPLPEQLITTIKEERERGRKNSKLGTLGLEPGPIPKYYTAINRLLIDQNDNLWVFTNEREKSELISVDIWGADDRFKQTVLIKNKLLRRPGASLAIYRNTLYELTRTEEDEETVFRFTLPEIPEN
ncbi:6-bladed beta-propeller [bacterium]|nr:6-bladed beta-propeller [bacterium]